MKASSKLVLLTVVLCGLMSWSALAQNTNKASRKAKPAAEQQGNNDKGGKRKDSDKSADQVRSNQPQRPEHPDKSDQSDVSEELRKKLEDLKQAQNEFVEEDKQLRQRLKEATDDDRARIRNEIQTKRQTFADQQREAREEIRRLNNDLKDGLKDRLKDQRDVLDAAKEQAKDKAKPRKGGGD